jgi:hypothetical protein
MKLAKHLKDILCKYNANEKKRWQKEKVLLKKGGRINDLTLVPEWPALSW